MDQNGHFGVFTALVLAVVAVVVLVTVSSSSSNKPTPDNTKTNSGSGGGSSYKGNGGGNPSGNKGSGTKGYSNGGSGSGGSSYYDDGGDYYSPPPDPRQYYNKPSIFDKLCAFASNTKDNFFDVLSGKKTVKQAASDFKNEGTSLLKEATTSFSKSVKEFASNTYKKAVDGFNTVKQEAKKAITAVGNFVEENKSNLIKIGIGVGAIAVGAIATVATGGAAAPVILAGLKTAAIAGASSAVTSTAFSVGKSLITGEKIDPKSLGKTAIDSFSTGFMMGGISSGVSNVIKSSSSLTNATNKVKTTVSNKVSEVKSSVSNKVNQVKDSIGNKISFIKDSFQKQQPDLGRKIEYIFGNAKGSAHNISRSMDMERNLNSIGIFDNVDGRKIITDTLHDAFNNVNNGIMQENGRVIVNSLVIGPNGFAGMKSIWDSNKLVSAIIFKTPWKSII